MFVIVKRIEDGRTFGIFELNVLYMVIQVSPNKYVECITFKDPEGEIAEEFPTEYYGYETEFDIS